MIQLNPAYLTQSGREQVSVTLSYITHTLVQFSKTSKNHFCYVQAKAVIQTEELRLRFSRKGIFKFFEV